MKPKFIISKNNNDVIWTSPNEESLEFVLSKVIPSGSKYLFVNDNSNVDYDFFKSYEFDWNLETGNETTAIFNLEIAKEIHLEHIRKKRSKIFPELDIEFMIALENGNQSKMQEISIKKQALRDITNIDFSNVTTAAELKNKWPTDVLGNSPYETI
jgi:hypothetical protein